jgi:hypothetical protein
MEVIIIRRLTSFLHTKRIDTFHYTMFHGLASRNEKGDFYLNAENLPSHSRLNLILNAHRVNRIIQPSLNLVVAIDIAENLSQRFGIHYARVNIKQVGNIEYEEGNMAHWDDPTYKDDGGYPDLLLKRSASKSKLKWPGPEIVELLPYDGEMLAEKSPVDSYATSGIFKLSRNEFHVVGTRKALVEHGYTWADGVHCFRSDIFSQLEKDFHPDYFETEKSNIN